MFVQCIWDGMGLDVVELLAWVHLVETLGCECAVQDCLHADGVIIEEERVNVEPERHGSVPELPNTLHRLEPARHADLDDAVPEGADVRDDVDVAGADVRGTVVGLGDLGVDPVEPCP